MPVTITPKIVTVNATVTPAPAPQTLQQSGAFLSFGGTTLTTGTYQFCGSQAAVDAILSTGGNYVEVGNMAGTFFAQQSTTPVGVYVLELGVEGTPSLAIAALQTWITANPGIFYAYLTPANWDTVGSTFNTMAANYENPTGQTYFFGTTSAATISSYAATNKALIMTAPSPTAASTEFQAAALFYQWLSNNPSAANQAAPLGYRFVYGVTPWPQLNNSTPINTVLSAYGNIIGTASEGGISTACIFQGRTMDGNQAMWWWSVDWLQIQAKQELALQVILGSNEQPPLVYNQNGINRLQGFLTDIGTEGIQFLLFETIEFSNTPFALYVAQFPANFKAGNYTGFACTVSAQNGFLTLTFNIDAVQFAA